MKWATWAISTCDFHHNLCWQEKSLPTGEQATFKDYGGLEILTRVSVYDSSRYIFGSQDAELLAMRAKISLYKQVFEVI